MLFKVGFWIAVSLVCGWLSTDPAYALDQAMPVPELGSAVITDSAFKSAGAATAFFLVVIGALAYVAKRLSPASKEKLIQTPIQVQGKVHLGSQIHASLIQVRDQEYLVVTGNKHNQGIAIVPAVAQSSELEGVDIDDQI